MYNFKENYIIIILQDYNIIKKINFKGTYIKVLQKHCMIIP